MSNRDIAKLYSEAVSRKKFDTIGERFDEDTQMTVFDQPTTKKRAKELIQLQNSYLSSPERLFELKDKFFSKDFRFLEFKQFIYLSHDTK